MINNKIKLIRLITGETVIGEISLSDRAAVIKNGIICEVKIDKSLAGNAKVEMIGLLNPLGATDNVTISTDHILFAAELRSEVVQRYQQIFGKKKNFGLDVLRGGV